MLDDFKAQIAPVYANRDYDEGNAIDKLATPSFWLKDFADGAAFLLSAYATGFGISKATSKIGSLTELAESVAAGTSSAPAKLLAEGAAKTLKYLKDAGLGTGNLLTNTANTIFEAGQEASEALKKSDEYYDAEIRIAEANGEVGKIKALQHEKELMGDRLMSSVFTSNYLLLSLTNIPESQWINGTFSDAIKRTKSNVLKSLAGTEATPELVEQAFKNYVTKPSLGKAFLKGFGLESILEENPQSAIQSHFYNKYIGGEGTNTNDWVSIAKQSAKNAVAFGLDLAALPVRAFSLGNIRAP